MSFAVTHCHFFVTRCHSLSLVVTRCYSLSLAVPLAVTHCHSLYHSLSFVVPLVVTRCHSMSLDLPLVCLLQTIMRHLQKNSVKTTDISQQKEAKIASLF